MTPSVSRNATSGDYVVVWVGPDAGGATDIFSRRLDPPAESASVPQGAVISDVAAVSSPTSQTLIWSATDTVAITSMTLWIDGVQTTVSNPYGTQYVAKYSASLALLSPGTHTYLITATDSAGISSQSTGSFTISPSGTTTSLTISNIVVDTMAGTISWTEASSDGILSSILDIDGTELTIGSVVGTKYLASYTAQLGSLPTGTCCYTITAVDVNYVAVTASNTFIVTASVSNGPTIANIVVAASASTPVITWNVSDAIGISSSSITVDGTSLPVCGPYGTAYNANYAGLLGSVSPGSHTYVITATDSSGVSSTSTGTFAVSGTNMRRSRDLERRGGHDG